MYLASSIVWGKVECNIPAKKVCDEIKHGEIFAPVSPIQTWFQKRTNMMRYNPICTTCNQNLITEIKNKFSKDETLILRCGNYEKNEHCAGAWRRVRLMNANVNSEKFFQQWKNHLRKKDE